MIHEVIAVGCGKVKRNTPSCAEDLYIGSLFKMAKAWAKSHSMEWFIVSAKHGLLLPKQIVAPYDVKLGKGNNALTEEQTSLWAATTREQIAQRYPRRRFVCLCSKEYERAFVGLDCEFPLRGMGLGKRMQWLKKTI